MKSILITGGSGSFGKAFVRRLLRDKAKVAGRDFGALERICIYSRGEHRQAAMREEFGNDSRLRWFIGDVRDRERLRRAMAHVDVVVHAAALKRIEVGHYNPIEMVRTNIEGAINVVEAATDAGVGRVVGLSSDKAWQPVSAYGQSKAMAESIFLASNAYRGPVFLVTRYGNVAGSEGSVIPKWRAQANVFVDVTSPDCTRFWMSMDEAVQLVYDAAFLPAKAEHLAKPIIPFWLPAYRLGDLVEAMDLKIGAVKGLPAWEKLHEGMADGLTSDKARRLSVAELRDRLVVDAYAL